MAKDEFEDIIDDEEFENLDDENEDELSKELLEDKLTKDKEGHAKFKVVNHSERALANGVSSDGEVATYANYALEYFDYRCALSGEKFVIFDEPIKREKNKLTTNLSAEHIVALVTGGNDIIPNIVPSVLQYNLQKNGYYILDWWTKARDIDGNPIYTPEKLLKLTNFMLKSLQIRKELGIKPSKREYRKRLMAPNEIDEYLAQEGVAEKLISDTITATQDDVDGKKILTKIPGKEGDIPSLAKQKEKDTKITESMFLVDAIEKLERENIPQEIIQKLKQMYLEVEGEIPFEIEVRQQILAVIEENGIEDNKYTVANDILINSGVLENLKDKNLTDSADVRKFIHDYFASKMEELKSAFSEESMWQIVNYRPEVIYNQDARQDEQVMIELYKKFIGENEVDFIILNRTYLRHMLKIKDWMEKQKVKTKPPRTPVRNREGKKIVPDDEAKLGSELRSARQTLIKTYEQLKTEEEKEEYKRQHPEYEKVKEWSDEIYSNNEKTVISEVLEYSRILHENGVNLLSIQLTKSLEDGSACYFKLKELKQEGIDIAKIIEENGLNGEFDFGRCVVSVLRPAYKGYGNNPITLEQKREVEELGLINEKVSETFRYLTLLKANGVNLEKIVWSKDDGKRKDCLVEDLKQEGIDIKKIIEENGLNGKFCIGSMIRRIKGAYNGRKTGIILSEEEKIELEKLGIIKISSKEKTLQIARVLVEKGVDLSIVQFIKNGKSILLKELEQKEIDIRKIIEENELDGEFPFGSNVIRLANIYRGTIKRKQGLTELEKRELEKLGLVKTENKSSISETLEVLRILDEAGIDLKKIEWSKNKKYILLEDLKQEGIDIKRIIEENGLDPKFKLGEKVVYLKGGYKGTHNATITETEKIEIERLGLVEKKSLITITLEIARILHDNGVDFSKLSLTKKINKKSFPRLLKELKQKGIDIEKIIEENGLDGEFKIGERINSLRRAYNGTNKCKITNEEKRLAEELGLVKPKKITPQSLGQAGFGSSVEECDKAQADLARRVEELESAKGVTQDEN